ncbi:hypothetical protein ROS217_11251 [Roseovarius sp. 217]|nr:hypothetical protein ROS217_11251 [Roseovarius sp. 217]
MASRVLVAMTFRRLWRGLRGVGLGPALLILLVSVRVATAAAVDCQHELAYASRSHLHVQEQIKLEAAALGGELCLIEDHPAALTTPAAEAAHDGPHLNTPCPFFKSQVALTDLAIAPVARDLSFSRVVRVYGDMRAAVGDLPTGYSPRAPPLVALG